MKRGIPVISIVIVTFVLVFVAACSMGSKSNSTPADSGGSSAKTATNSSTSAPAVPANIAGAYNITGTNPTGAPYKGTLEVIAHGDVFQFRWNAGSQYDGVGVKNGGVVAVAFAAGANGQGCGVVDYVIQGDGTLDGKWGYWGVNESGTERGTKTSGPGLEGDYDVTGKNPNGKDYKSQLTVIAIRSNYRFVWSNNTDGFGIKQGDNVAVGIGGSRCGFVAYEIKPDGTLEGIWGGYGTDKTGTEKATKQ